MAVLFQINLSNGGVPKLPFHRAKLTKNGVLGDRQNDLRRHGGPDRALCLYALECIQKLQAEGHPIFPGSTGENLTIAGLNWDDMRPGVRLDIGPQVSIEITAFTPPCNKIKASFAGGDVNRISQKQNPGWSRLYAKILRVGLIRVGDTVSMANASDGGKR